MELLFTSTSIKRLIYLVLVALSAFSLQAVLNPAQSNWLVWSALTLALIMNGDTFKRRITVMVICGLVLGFAVFIADCLQPYFILSGLFVFIVTILCAQSVERHPDYFYEAMIINLFTIVATGLPLTLVASINRFVYIELGLAIAVVWQFIFYPYYVRGELNNVLIRLVRNLRYLNAEIFDCLLEADYPDNIYLYERRIYLQKNRFLQSITRLRDIAIILLPRMDANEKSDWIALLDKIDILYDNMLDYAQIRRRVTDHSTFGVCSDELQQIRNAIEEMLNAFSQRIQGKKYFMNTDALAQAIQKLEVNYNNILQISAREPLVFLLFIDSLKEFCDSIHTISVIALPSFQGYS